MLFKAQACGSVTKLLDSTMEAGGPEQATTSQFPEPPGYYQLYEAGPHAGPEPPAPITGCVIHVFGEPFDLEEPYYKRLDTNQLYQTQPDGAVNIKQELLTLNKGLLFMFLDLLNTLVQQPSQYSASLNPINQTLLNMNHLLNMARPIQARETLKHALRAQIDEKKTALMDLTAKAAHIKQELLAVSQQLAVVGGDMAESAPGPAAAAAAAAGQQWQQQAQRDQQQQQREQQVAAVIPAMSEG